MTHDIFEGATGFITGGAQGIGLGIAKALAERGARLAIADIDEQKLEEAGSLLRELTPTETYVLDVRDRDGFAVVADKVEAALGPVSLLFNNAGVACGKPLAELDYGTWDFVMDINVKGVMNGLQTFVPRMIARGGGGYVVNTASGAGLASVGSGFLYGMSKYAVVGLSEYLRDELDEWGIGVSVLCPGPVATSIVRNTIDQQRREGREPMVAPDEQVQETETMLALGARPEAVGEMVIEAMVHRRLYIHTDEVMAEAVKLRTEAILAAMPSALAGGDVR